MTNAEFFAQSLSYLDGFIFDLDGTLIDSSQSWHNIDVKFLKKRGLSVPEDYAKAIVCLGFYESALYTINRFGLNESVEEIVAEWSEMALYEHEHNIKLNDGAESLLRTLKSEGKKLALATASSEELFTAVLKHNGVYDCFDAFASIDDVCRGYLHNGGRKAWLSCEELYGV
ncbi:MAG: HAD family phosphatase [Ruminococcus sp.]|nr:HAD family phosphatase [Ruminococcus sp.]